MTTENLLLQANRIPRFRNIETPPQLFFTVNDGKHQQSMKIIDALARAHRENPVPTTPPLCTIFESWDAVPKDLSDNSVIVFDDGWVENCFSRLCWQENAGRRPFLHFQRLSVLWGFAVNPTLDDSRIPSAVNQLRADFGKNFLKHIDKGKFPWGDCPKPPAEGAQQKSNRTRRKKKRQYDEEPLHLLWTS